MTQFLGIDLGTTFLRAAVCSPSGICRPLALPGATAHGLPTHLVRHHGDVLDLPFLTFPHTQRAALCDSENACSAPNRLLASTHQELLEQQAMALAPTHWTSGPRGDAACLLDGTPAYPEELLACFFAQVIEAAQAQGAGEMIAAVIAVPLGLGAAARRAICHAARLAGLGGITLVNAPVAASLGLQPAFKPATSAAAAPQADESKPQTQPETDTSPLAVIDWGGGTFDAALMHWDEKQGQVLALATDAHLGGMDIDAALVGRQIDILTESFGPELCALPQVRARLVHAWRKARIALDTQAEIRIHLPFLGVNEHGPIHVEASFSRAELAEVLDPYICRAEALCRQLMAQLCQDKKLLGQVRTTLRGGLLATPEVSDRLMAALGVKPKRATLAPLMDNEKDGEAAAGFVHQVALGAALWSAALGGEKKQLLPRDKLGTSLALRDEQGKITPIVAQGSFLPAQGGVSLTLAAMGNKQHEAQQLSATMIQHTASLGEDHQVVGTVLLTPRKERSQNKTIELSVTIDQHGLATALATDQDGSPVQLEWTLRPGLTSDEVLALAKAAQAAAEARRRRQEVLALHERATMLATAAERRLGELDPAWATELQAETQAAIVELRFTLEASAEDDNDQQGCEPNDTQQQEDADEEGTLKDTQPAGHQLASRVQTLEVAYGRLVNATRNQQAS